MYYYLNDTDIIQEGDECTGYEGTCWVYCESSIGKTISVGLSDVPNAKVRRKILVTPKGNHL